MKESLRNSITQWERSSPRPGLVRSANTTESKVILGEYEIALKMSTTVADMAQSEKVSLTRKLKTSNQAGSESPDTDIQDFEECAKELERDFEKKCRITLDRLARMQNPDRLNERNPY